jgi:hypothetical protein
MIIEHIVDEGRICDLLDDAYQLAKQYNTNHIVFIKTFNIQSSSLNENRFAISYLKEYENGDKKVVYTNYNLLEISDIDILYRAIYTYKKTNKNYKEDVSIDVWTTLPLKYIGKFYVTGSKL